MTRTRLVAGLMAVSAAAALMTGLASASATTRPHSRTAVVAMPTATSVGHSRGFALPRGVHPARPPRAGTGLRVLRGLRGLRPEIAGDTIGCFDQESILSAANNLWVSAELGYGGANYAMLRARASVIGPWEQFALCYDYTAGFWYIVSDANSNAVSTELGYGGGSNGMLRARASVVGPWEQYVLSCTSAGTLIIGSLANNLWVSTELGYGGAGNAMLRARASGVGPWEQYLTLTGRIGC